MKSVAIAGALAVAMFAAGPALAASNTNAQANSNQQANAATTQSSANSGNSQSMQSLGQNNLRQQLQEQLSKAGFTSIKIMPSSFYVQAKDKKGEPVAMVIGPDSFTEVTQISNQASNNQQPSNGAQQQQQSSQGTNNNAK